MSNDDFPPPQPPDGSETGLGDLAAGSGDGTPPPPSVDATQVMPVTPSLPANNPGAAPLQDATRAVPPPAPGAPGGPGAPIVPTEQLPGATVVQAAGRRRGGRDRRACWSAA